MARTSKEVFGKNFGEFFDGVGLVAVGDEEGVFGLDDDEVIDAEEGDVGVFAIVKDDVVLGLDLGDDGVGGVVAALLGEILGDRNPRARRRKQILAKCKIHRITASMHNPRIQKIRSIRKIRRKNLSQQ